MKIILGLLFMTATTFVTETVRAASISDFADFSLVSDGHTLLPGRLYVPPEATSDPTTPRPLVLFLHGGGESGTNNVAQVNANIDNLLAEAKRRGAFLYAPQTPDNWSSTAATDRVMSMVDRAAMQWNVDNDRLYITGLSNGGGGTWNMLSRYDHRFAAAIPICGVAPAGDFVPSRLLDDAIFAFHARDDNIVPVTTSRNVVNSILDAAHEPRPDYPPLNGNVFFPFGSEQRELYYFEFGGGGHNIWPVVYNIPELYDLVFAHSLAIPEPNAHLLALTMGLALIGWSGRPSSRGRRRLLGVNLS